MKNEKLYFKNEDDNFCCHLEDHINEAKEEGLDEIELIEAVPSKEKGYYWCTHYANVVEQGQCCKAECERWERYKNSNLCYNRGQLFYFGEKVKFKVPYIDHISGTKPLSERTADMLNKMAKQAYKTK